jgi:transposase
VAGDHPRARTRFPDEVHLGGAPKELISYPNFWKQFYRKFPQYREATITAREFEPGERVEVDYAGDPIEWYEIKTGEIHKAYVFVSGLGFSQLLFAWAAEDMKSRNWLGCHRRMFEYYSGVPHYWKAFQ